MQLAVCALIVAAACIGITQATYYCRAPSFPSHGWHSGGQRKYFSVGDTIHFRCRSGYRLQGSSQTQCGYSRRSYDWTNPIPTCVYRKQPDDNDDKHDESSDSSSSDSSSSDSTSGVFCPTLSFPQYGLVRYTCSGRRPGCFAKYFCNNGYILHGYRYRKCLPSGHWSGEIPTCGGGHCRHPEPPEYGWVKYKSRAVGAKVWNFCNKGYVLHGSETRTCKPNGKWDPEVPVCKRPEGCEKLRNPDNGYVITKGRKVGSYAKYVCDMKHYLVGNKFRKCLETGWTGEDPVCKPILCDKPERMDHGWIFVSDGFRRGSIATYKCGYGYVVKEGSGDKERECQANGEWSGTPITCVPSARKH